jgi:hypothetical protein
MYGFSLTYGKWARKLTEITYLPIYLSVFLDQFQLLDKNSIYTNLDDPFMYQIKLSYCFISIKKLCLLHLTMMSQSSYFIIVMPYINKNKSKN